ncbi:hypothetical protein MKQ70_19550 [Chitinophaga sedimenti]|uniref:hypothetical protein n=1 Tax=Chitinophaga sedimenti TaxID=2033606 RepID=UPI0020037721|nr:hypothetical protein [Chitinophaga sedimenti]MCK7557081.1 hypothetical protein [Chitinophaga sedimenti]
MKYTFRIASLALVGLLSLSYSSTKAQLKIGSNPNTIDPKALLHLESSTKGLLLPNIPALTNIGTTGVANGMIIYLADATNPGLYVMQDGTWHRMASDEIIQTSFWKMGGNNVTGDQSLGLKSGANLSFLTNDMSRLTIKSDGQFQFGVQPTAGAATDLDVLMINTNGDVIKRTISENAFGPVVTKITSGGVDVDGGVIFSTNAATTHTAFGIAADGTTKTLTFNTPLLSVGGAATYGFLTKADYDALTAADRIALADAAAADATSDQKGATLAYNSTTGKYELKLAFADDAMPGIMSIQNQSFRGDKEFKNAVAVNQTLTVTGDATLSGNVTMGAATSISTVGGSVLMPDLPAATAPVTGANYQILYSASDGSGIKQLDIDPESLTPGVATFNGEKGAITLTLDAYPLAASVTTPAVVADGTDPKIQKIQIPEANSTTVVRGLISNADQILAGRKRFENDMTVGANLLPTSTLDVKGSFSAAIREVVGDYTLLATDYTLIAKGAAVNTVTLPAASSCPGRIYNIKKVPTNAATPDENVITINTADGGDIESGPSTTMFVPYSSISVQSSGGQWYILRRN